MTKSQSLQMRQPGGMSAHYSFTRGGWGDALIERGKFLSVPVNVDRLN
jgi:hypothetical protein